MSSKRYQKLCPPTVRLTGSDVVASESERRLEQEIRFCATSDGVRIAYASVGEGPPLIKAANWLNHLEYDWDSPIWRHVFRGLAADRRLIRYDARGNGLSDWDVEDISFDAFVATWNRLSKRRESNDFRFWESPKAAPSPSST